MLNLIVKSPDDFRFWQPERLPLTPPPPPPPCIFAHWNFLNQNPLRSSNQRELLTELVPLLCPTEATFVDFCKACFPFKVSS